MADATVFDNLTTVHNERDAASRILWTSTTTGYIGFFENTVGSHVVYKTTNSGVTWAEVGSGTRLTCDPRSVAWYWEAQNGNPFDADLLHVIWLDATDHQTQHATFDIGAEAWSAMDVAESWTSVSGSSGSSSIGAAVATNGDILVVSRADQDGEVNTSLWDESGSAWSSVGGSADNSPWFGPFNTDQVRVDVGNGGADFIVYMMDESSDALRVRGYRVAAAAWAGVSAATLVDNGLDQQEFAVAYDWTADESLLVFENNRGQTGNDLAAYTVNWDGSATAPSLTAEADVLTDDTASGALTVSYDPINDEMTVCYTSGTQLSSNSLYQKTSAAGGTYSWGTASAALNATARDIRAVHGSVITSAGGRLAFAFQDDDLNDLFYPENDTEVSGASPQLATPSAAGLTTTGYAPAVAASDHKLATPGTVAAAITAYAAAVVASNHQSVTPGAASLTTAGYAPAVAATDHQLVTPGAASLTAASYAPAVTASDHQSVTPGTVALTTAAYAPSVATPSTVTPSTASLTATGYAPDVTGLQGLTVTPGATSLTATPYAPAVAATAHQAVTPSVANLTATGYAPDVATPSTVTPGAAGLVATGYAPDVAAPRTVTPSVAGLTATGYAPAVGTTNHQAAEPSTRSIVIEVFEPSVLVTANVAITPGVAALLLTGYAPSPIATERTPPIVIGGRWAPEVGLGGRWAPQIDINGRWSPQIELGGLYG